jgi:thiamine-monophosphate kinase
MAERDLIRYIREIADSVSFPWLDVGIGDDCAVLRVDNDARLVATTDMLIEGTHYRPGTAPELIGRKAIARALSDLAAMAALPRCVLAAASFRPETDEEFCQRVCRAMWDTAEEFGAPLIGGDIGSGSGPHTVTVTALGMPGPAGWVTRAGARPDDAICVSGSLGGSLHGRHLTFSPRLQVAIELAEGFDIHAMIDISDGLSTDLTHIMEASGTGAVIDASAVPVHEDLREELQEASSCPQALIHRALNDGEDYELLFCLPQEQGREAEQNDPVEVPITVIGRVTRDAGLTLRWSDGTTQVMEEDGWEHLSK